MMPDTPKIPRTTFDVLREAMSSWPRFQPIPSITVPEIKIPSPEERNAYRSARALIARMARRIEGWKSQLPSDQQPAILALLSNGMAIRVSSLSPAGHNGIIVEGETDNGPCMLVAHQATIQLLCFVEQIAPNEAARPIGFNTDWSAAERVPEHMEQQEKANE